MPRAARPRDPPPPAQADQDRPPPEILHPAISARFGDELLRDGYTVVPNLLLKYMALVGTDAEGRVGMTFAELVLVQQIWCFWWFEKLPYPSIDTIAARMGVVERQARRLVKSLREKGLLVTRPRFARGSGQLTSEFDFEPLLNALREIDRRLNPEAYASERRRRTAHEPDPVRGWGKTPRPARASQATSPDGSVRGARQPPGDTSVRGDPTGKSVRPPEDQTVPRGLPAVSPEEDEDPTRPSTGTDESSVVAAAVPPASPRDDVSPPRSPAKPRLTRMRPESFLEVFARDFSLEMGDPDHQRENHAQLSRLYHESSLTPEEFTALLYEARATTRRWLGNVAKPRSAPGGRDGAKNTAPYFFAVLTNLLRPPAAPAAPPDLEPAAVWAEVCHRLLETIGEAAVQTWVAPARPLGRRRGAFAVEAPNGFLHEWLDARYRPHVELALEHVVGRPVALELVRRDGAARPRAAPRRPGAPGRVGARP